MSALSYLNNATPGLSVSGSLAAAARWTALRVGVALAIGFIGVGLYVGVAWIAPDTLARFVKTASMNAVPTSTAAAPMRLAP